MTVEELCNNFNFEELTVNDKLKQDIFHSDLHPIYEKHLTACWIIQDIWGHVANENLSTGKARELTAAVIEMHMAKTNRNNIEKEIDNT